MHVIGSSTSGFAAPLLAAVIASFWGWRGSYISIAIPTAVLGIILYVLLGRKIKINPSDKNVEAGSIGADPAADYLYHLVVFIIMNIVIGAVYQIVISFIPLYLVDYFGFAEETGAGMMALVYSAGLWAAPVGGYLSDHLGERTIIFVAGFLLGPTIYLFRVIPPGIGLGIILILLGMMNYIRVPAIEAYITSHCSINRGSTVLGIYFFGSSILGGLLTPGLGNLIDRFGFHPGFMISGIVPFIVTLLSLILIQYRKA